MLVIKKIEKTMIKIMNTNTKTPFRVPSHWLEIKGKEINEGDVIKFIKDEVNTHRLKKSKKNS